MVAIILLLLALAAVLLGNTAQKTARARKLTGSDPVPGPDELDKYTETLRKMIRCKTVSTEGSYDDTEFARLRAVMEAEFPLLHQAAERHIFSHDCWVYKLPGRDQCRNILLMAHHDVVPVDEAWDHPPFAGEAVEGKIYGRGTADTKGALCAIFYAVEQLLEAGFVPPVNLYIASSHNEELGGDGITSARDWFQQQGIRFEVVLDEGGAIVDPPLGKMRCERCAMVAVHEKGRLKVTCTAATQSSHVSLTGFRGNPVERMAAFVQDISSKNRFLRRFDPQVTAMFASLGPYCGSPLNVLLCNLWLFGPLLLKVLPKINPTAGGMLGTTCNFQSIEGSMQSKVCTAKAMLRYINEADLDRDFGVFQKTAKKYGIAVEVDHREFYPAADTSSKAYAYMMDCLTRVFPRYPAAPYILPAGTDAWKLTPLCDCVLRFAPTRLDTQQLGAIHGANENLDTAAIYEAAVFYQYFLAHYE